MKPIAHDISRVHYGAGLTFQQIVGRLGRSGFDVSDREHITQHLALLVAARVIEAVAQECHGVRWTEFRRNNHVRTTETVSYHA